MPITSEEVRRITVEFSAKDFRLIEREIARLEKANGGYRVTMSKAIRDLVRERWATPPRS